MTPVTFHSLVALAAPAAASVLLNNAFKIIDQYSVQWLGVTAQAAIGACTFILIGMFAIYAVISSGAGPLFARATGAQNPILQKQVIGNALSGAAVIGGIALALMGLMAPWLCSAVGLVAETHELASTYLQWLACFGFPIVLAPTIDALFIAAGQTRVVLLLQLTASLLNISLNPLLIYHLKLGIGGAALATGMSRGVAVLIGLYLLQRRFNLQSRNFRWNRTLHRMIRVGLPASSGIALFALVYWALLRWTVSPLGPAVNAALGIGFSALEGLTWPIFFGSGMAVASLIGRYLGAGLVDQASRTVRLALPVFTLTGLGASALFWFAGAPLCRLFTDNPDTLRETILYTRILACAQLFVAYECLADAVLEGAGDTRTVLAWSAPLNILRVPLAWLFAIHWGYGAAAVWWAITLTSVLKSAGKWSSVLRGRWRSVQI